jgi:C-terminal processing protease CtpA/Prc
MLATLFAVSSLATAADNNNDAKLFDSPALASAYRENLSDDEKVAGLSKFWSEVKYYFVYVERLKELDWDKLYLEYLPKVRATTSTVEYYKVLSEMCAKLRDGHTNIYPARELWDREMANPKIRTRLIEGRVLVTEVLDPALRSQGVEPGGEVVAVDGEPAVAYGRRAVAPFVSASTKQDLEQRAFGYQFLAGPAYKSPTLTFRDARGKQFDIALKRYGSADVSIAKTRRAPFELRMLPDGVAYVALNSFGDDAAAIAFLAAFDQVSKARALVIDLRNNGGGNSDVGYRVLATLTDKPFAPGRWSTRKYLPAYRAWGRAMPNLVETEEEFKPDPARKFTGPVRVLTSAGTYSAAEDFAIAFDAAKRGVIVGETTGGSTGQPLMVKLPGGGMARICTKADTYPDGREWVGIGIKPGLEVHPTVADVQQGRDTVLEAAIRSLKL